MRKFNEILEESNKLAVMLDEKTVQERYALYNKFASKELYEEATQIEAKCIIDVPKRFSLDSIEKMLWDIAHHVEDVFSISLTDNPTHIKDIDGKISPTKFEISVIFNYADMYFDDDSCGEFLENDAKRNMVYTALTRALQEHGHITTYDWVISAERNTSGSKILRTYKEIEKESDRIIRRYDLGQRDQVLNMHGGFASTRLLEESKCLSITTTMPLEDTIELAQIIKNVPFCIENLIREELNLYVANAYFDTPQVIAEDPFKCRLTLKVEYPHTFGKNGIVYEKDDTKRRAIFDIAMKMLNVYLSKFTWTVIEGEPNDYDRKGKVREFIITEDQLKALGVKDNKDFRQYKELFDYTLVDDINNELYFRGGRDLSPNEIEYIIPKLKDFSSENASEIIDYLESENIIKDGKII